MNGDRFEHRARRLHVLLAAALCAVLLVALDGHWLVKVAAISIGFFLGRVMGASEWSRLRRQIDTRNVAVIYTEDSAYFAVLTALAIASLSPWPVIRAGLVIAFYPEVVAAMLVGAAGACVGWAFVLYRRIQAYERSSGPLRVRTFYARSLVGPEALIGRAGTVVETCAPDGRVSIGAEVWFARSIGDVSLTPGTPVVIRDLDGLRLIVEREGRPEGRTV
jgi:membrane protein implicated in regulation of membrane protease activity